MELNQWKKPGDSKGDAKFDRQAAVSVVFGIQNRHITPGGGAGWESQGVFGPALDPKSLAMRQGDAVFSYEYANPAWRQHGESAGIDPQSKMRECVFIHFNEMDSKRKVVFRGITDDRFIDGQLVTANVAGKCVFYPRNLKARCLAENDILAWRIPLESEMPPKGHPVWPVIFVVRDLPDPQSHLDQAQHDVLVHRKKGCASPVDLWEFLGHFKGARNSSLAELVVKARDDPSVDLQALPTAAILQAFCNDGDSIITHMEQKAPSDLSGTAGRLAALHHVTCVLLRLCDPQDSEDRAELAGQMYARLMVRYAKASTIWIKNHIIGRVLTSTTKPDSAVNLELKSF